MTTPKNQLIKDIIIMVQAEKKTPAAQLQTIKKDLLNVDINILSELKRYWIKYKESK